MTRPLLPGRLPLSALALAGLALLAACDTGTDPDPQEPAVVGEVEVSIDTEQGRVPISPFIYGSNQDHPALQWTVRRHGGNRITGYNWETNFSNAGADWQHQSDLFAISSVGLPESEAEVPARALTHFHDISRAAGAESIVSLQMAGYAAADGAGPVAPSETAPSARWVRVEPRRGAPFPTSPGLSDGTVYMDELIARLVQRYGGAASPDGIRWYSLDNEPALWSHTHPRIHPDPVGAAELMQRSIALASAVKEVDPAAEVLGPALYGMSAFLSLQDAPDWEAVGAGHDWFIDYYLERMREAEAGAGRRLLDVLDVHWYPEARGDHRIIDPAATTPADAEARLQAPRTLWDDTYREDSWIGEWLGDYLPLLPRLQQSIEQHYPGTRLAITEYSYGGGATVSGGLAQADVLGVFGREGVYLATLWGIQPSDSYLAAAFRLYRNYDGRQGRYGDVAVAAAASDRAAVSVYAALDSDDPSALHVILINKRGDGALAVDLEVDSSRGYTTGEAWGFGAGSPTVTRRQAVGGIRGNAFRYVVPALSAVHLVLR